MYYNYQVWDFLYETKDHSIDYGFIKKLFNN